jgi:hypothetical protein
MGGRGEKRRGEWGKEVRRRELCVDNGRVR